MDIKQFLEMIFGVFDKKDDQELLSPLPEGHTDSVTPPPEKTPAPASQNPALDEYIFDATPYGEQIAQPSPEVAGVLQEYFPEDATRSAVVAQTESGYNPEAQGVNKNKSVDTGLFQINSDTFKDFMNRKKHVLEEYGINSYEQMKNPIFNAAMAKIIQKEQGWNAWYGPKDKGYNLNPDIKI